VLVVCAAQGKERTYFPGFTCTETVRM